MTDIRKEIEQNYYLADIKQYVIVKCKDGKHRVFAEVSLDIVDMVGEEIEVIGFYETHCQARFICGKRNGGGKEMKNLKAHVVIDIDGKKDKGGNFVFIGDIAIIEYPTKEMAEREALDLWQHLTIKEKKERKIIAGLVNKTVDNDGDISYWNDNYLNEYISYGE